MSLPKTETRPIPVITTLFFGSFSLFGAATVGEAMALIVLHLGAAIASVKLQLTIKDWLHEINYRLLPNIENDTNHILGSRYSEVGNSV